MIYVYVIVPLRLDWEPVYRVPEGMSAVKGDRVRVKVAGREYIGVVHDQVVEPNLEESRIQNILENCSAVPVGMESRPKTSGATAAGNQSLAPITTEELNLWEFVADYYMCTIGEVYKAAYPAARVKVETTKSRRSAAPQSTTPLRCKRATDVGTCRRIYDAFAEGRPALLVSGLGGNTEARLPGEDARRIADILAQRTVEEGRSVLILTPEVEASPEGYLQYNSAATPAARRDIAQLLRSGKPCIVTGTRMATFLPFTNLGLVIVLDEHNANYKQPEPAPRYNGRDVAVKLASIHGANVLLCSEVPSMESLANCDSGKYTLVQEEGREREMHTPGRHESEGRWSECEPAVQEYSDALIDVTAEKRKNGMIGSLSRKLIARMADTLEQKQRVALLLPWKDTDDVEIEARKLFPEARTRLAVMSLSESRRKDLDKYALTALLCADFLLKGKDFRADEKALGLLVELHQRIGDRLVVQTADSAHPVFAAALSSSPMDTLRTMMPLRRQFMLPPYTRIIDIVFRDNNETRRHKMMRELSHCLRISGLTESSIRITLVKDRNLAATKREIMITVNTFAKEHNYREFLHFDVDPF